MVGPWQLAIILLICLVLFGTKKLRGIGGDLGSAISEFKNSMESSEEKDSDDNTSAATSENTEDTNE